MTTQLTPRQQQILAFITDQQATGLTPSMREIGAAVGLASTSAVRAQLQNLEEAGYIRLAAGKARAIQVLKPEPTPDNPKVWYILDVTPNNPPGGEMIVLAWDKETALKYLREWVVGKKGFNSIAWKNDHTEYSFGTSRDGTVYCLAAEKIEGAR